MDLLDELLQDQREGARQKLREGVDRDGPAVEVINFNAFEVVLDRGASEARVFDVLGATANPVVIGFEEFRGRLR